MEYITREYITRNARLDELQGGIKISRRNNNNFRYADDTTLVVGSEEELKSLLMKVKEEREKTGLKLNSKIAMIHSTKFCLDLTVLLPGKSHGWRSLVGYSP